MSIYKKIDMLLAGYILNCAEQLELKTEVLDIKRRMEIAEASRSASQETIRFWINRCLKLKEKTDAEDH